MFNFIFHFAQSKTTGCQLPDSVFGIPTWYKYLDGTPDANGVCRIGGNFSVDRIDSLLSIGLAAIEILLFIAGIVAVAYVIYGGFRYVLSQGNPDETGKAKDAILNAVIGLVIAILASAIVRFVAGQFTSGVKGV